MAGLKRSSFGDALKPHALERQHPSHPNEWPSEVQRAAYVLVIVLSSERFAHSRVQVVKTGAMTGPNVVVALTMIFFWIFGAAPGERVTFSFIAQCHRTIGCLLSAPSTSSGMLLNRLHVM